MPAVKIENMEQALIARNNQNTILESIHDEKSLTKVLNFGKKMQNYFGK